jgi:hypothetical protein
MAPRLSLRWLLGLAGFSIALPSQQVTEVKGIVVDSSGNPVPYAYLSTTAGLSTVTRTDGRFALRGSGLGDSITFTARRIGFRPFYDRIAVDRASGQPIRLIMTALPTTLATVEVHNDATGYDEYLDRSGYYRRVAKAIDGQFISYDRIVKRNPTELTSMLSDVRGIRVERDYGKRGKGGSYVLGRGGVCTMGLVVDGRRIEVTGPSNEAVQPRIPAIINGTRVSVTTPKNYGLPAGSIDEMVPVDMIGAIEVYPSAGSVPNEFHQLTDGCGLIVVWTRYRK